jgi:Cyclic nucleotide-binding domain
VGRWIDALGYLGALLILGTYSMKTMIPLRIIALCASGIFVVYGYMAPVYPQLLLHGVLLPLNSLRVYQMLQLIGKVRSASQGDLNMDWLKPFMSRRACKADEIIFRKGDLSSAMFYTVSGSYRLNEIGQDVGPGQVIGEVGLIAPDSKRTLTFECTQDGELLTISYEQVKQLYFQNPKFGFYFLQLISGRLFQDIARLQDEARSKYPPAEPGALGL